MKRYTLTESKLRSMIREAVKSVLNEKWDEGYTGWNGNYGETSWVSRNEANMRNKFEKLKRWGIIYYDHFEDWKRDGYPHANEV